MPHFLRRTKQQIFKMKSAELADGELESNEMPLKTDLVIWIPLSDVQRKVYKLILE